VEARETEEKEEKKVITLPHAPTSPPWTNGVLVVRKTKLGKSWMRAPFQSRQFL
jgi:hypothetical protein